ncbi:MAG: SRPBCC family protein [Pyrinomonadaceae bacterium]|nr:SRPBCC family protein [Pyrinomonadaceae bacterium]
MLKKVLLSAIVIISAIVALFCVIAAFQPEDFRITRSATIKAPPARVFEQIDDFHKWESWSPWAKIDPTMRSTYSGSEKGVGAAYAWSGNGDAGEGKMTILESKPPDHLKIDLEFTAPFAAKNLIEFSLAAEGDNTNVTWSMTGKRNFGMKAFSLLVNMDKLVGSDFEKGLAQLRSTVESGNK